MSGFTIMDPKGLHYPYVQGVEWKRNRIERKEAVAAEGSLREVHKEEEEPYDSHSRWADSLESMKTKVKHFPREGRACVASDIMSQPVISVRPDDSFEDLWDLICLSQFRHVPVLSDEDELVGIVSDRKILDALHAKGKRPKKVRDVMVRYVLCANPTTEVNRIARIFIRERIGAMPIVNENNKLVGMLTRSDILRLIVQMPSFRIYEERE